MGLDLPDLPFEREGSLIEITGGLLSLLSESGTIFQKDCTSGKFEYFQSLVLRPFLGLGRMGLVSESLLGSLG